MENAKAILGVVIMFGLAGLVFLGLIGIAMPGLSDSGSFILGGVIGAIAIPIVWRVFDFGEGSKQTSALAPGSSRMQSPSTGGKDYSLVPHDWERELSENGFSRHLLQDLCAEIDAAYSRSTKVYPRQKKLFRALYLTPFDKVRVVIIGQDPYPAKGRADGLAFSIKKGNPDIPRTLRRIFDNLYSDLYPLSTRPTGGDLTPWAKQGVLLLNSALTVERNATAEVARHHQMVWEPFSAAVIRAVNSRATPIVFIFWGDKACEFETLVSNPHLILRSAHPSPRNIGRSTVLPAFESTHPFSEANCFLGSRKIDWRIS